MNNPTIKNIIEFALLTAGEPLDMKELQRLLADEEGDMQVSLPAALEELENEWGERSLRLTRVADGYQFISREGYADYLGRLRPKKTARLSRQLLEVLAVIAYQQPATRGDIEQTRGVSVSALHLATLEEFGWIEEVGRRETPGRPVLFGTTNTFLNDLAISSLEELPQLEPEDMAASFDEVDTLPLMDNQSATQTLNADSASSTNEGNEENGDSVADDSITNEGSDADSNVDSDVSADSDADSNEQSDENSNVDSDVSADSDADSNEQSDENSNVDSDASADSDADSNEQSDENSNVDSNASADSDADSNEQSDENSNVDSDVSADSDADSNEQSDENSNVDSNASADSDADSNEQSDENSNVDSNASADPNEQSDENSNVDSNANADSDADSNEDPNVNSDTSDTNKQ
ncbi:MAG: SMC-Scp complex subunit ScpB [Gammaproteobacteria bacterium WSBS_2016_MAG_OTU1]